MVPCSQCGAPLDADGTTPILTCAFCHQKTVIPDDVWRRIRTRQTPVPAQFPPATRIPMWIYFAVPAGIVLVVGAIVWGVRRMTSAPGPQAPHGFAVANSACDGKRAACSLDKGAMLECDGDKLVVALMCRGPAQCHTVDQGDSVSCDYTRAEENDPCNVSDSACSMDAKSELRCNGVKWVRSGACKGPDGCTTTPSDKGFTLSCDDHVADPGDPCLADDRWACTPDGTRSLRCARGSFLVATVCDGPKGCVVSKNRATDQTTVACDSKK